MRETNQRIFLVREESDLGKVYDYAEEELQSGELEITVEPYKPVRSILQNRLMWAYYEQIAKSTGCTKNQMHLYYRNEFLKPKLVEVMGKVFNELPSTTDLNTKEMAEYITNIEIHAAENGIDLLAPAYREDAIR